MPVTCPRCHRSNRDGARFCQGCGGPLPQPAAVCPRCGASNRAGARFCLRCGAGLPPAVTPPIRPSTPPAAPGPAPFPVPPVWPAVSSSPTPRPSGPPLGTGQLAPQTMLSGRYIIVQCVGKGGMGAVYKATDSRLPGKLWAVKEMSGSAVSDPADRQQAIANFMQEAQILATLNHSHIPKVIDVFSEGDRHYLVMEFVEGQTLAARLQQQAGRPLDPAEVVRWAVQICDVLGYLHGRQPAIVFRDLKPSNIMLDRNDTVKLIDFGIVRFFKPGKKNDTMSFGTAGYSPPEQYGKGQTDARSDVYSLGATLHHLLTARDPALHPFHFDDVCRLAPGVPADLGCVIMRAVSLKPAERWQSAAEMQQALLGQSRAPAPASPRVVASARPAPTLGSLLADSGLKYQELKPEVFGASFTVQRRSEAIVTLIRELHDLLVLSCTIDVPKRSRDRALENLLRGTFAANLVKVVGSAQDGYMACVEVTKAGVTGQVLAALLRGLVNMADLQEAQTRERAIVEAATLACNRQLLNMPGRLGFDLVATCRKESIPCTPAGQGKYHLEFEHLPILLLQQSTVLSFVLQTDTKPQVARQEAFYQQMLEVNWKMNVGKVALNPNGELAFLYEVPIDQLDANRFQAAFWSAVAGPGVFWDELIRAAS